MVALRPLFRSCGRNFVFCPYGVYSYRNITVGNDVYIGPTPTFLAEVAPIEIGSKVLFGPGVTLITGDHVHDIIGAYMFDIKEKRPTDDLPIVIEDDVWLGARSTVLKGVTIGRGSIIGAGSVVTKSIPPYSIALGVPAKIYKPRFSSEEIKLHEAALGIAS